MEEIIDLGIAQIKVTKEEIKKTIIIANCPFCEKKVKGTSHSQIAYNMETHVKQKHKDHEDYEIFLEHLEKDKDE